MKRLKGQKCFYLVIGLIILCFLFVNHLNGPLSEEIKISALNSNAYDKVINQDQTHVPGETIGEGNVVIRYNTSGHDKATVQIKTTLEVEKILFNKTKTTGNNSETALDENLAAKRSEYSWTIMLTINNGYSDFFFNWFTAYKRLNITLPIAVITEDRVAYQKLKNLDLREVTANMGTFKEINATVSFGSKLFNDMSVRRHTYILQYLENGKNVIFTDTDTVWVRNPVPYFKGDYDIWMQFDAPKQFCPGTMAVRSNKRTKQFFRKLTRQLSLRPQADQPVINKLIRKTSGLRVKGLNGTKFPSGRQYFKLFSEIKRKNVVVVHNNWIKGHRAKLYRFQRFNLWVLKNSTDFVNSNNGLY